MSEPNRALRFDVTAESLSTDDDMGPGDAAYDLIMADATVPELLRALASRLETTIRAGLWSPDDGDCGHVLTIRIYDSGVHFDPAERAALAPETRDDDD